MVERTQNWWSRPQTTLTYRDSLEELYFVKVDSNEQIEGRGCIIIC